MNSIKVNILKWLLPILFVIYYGDISFYSHIHMEEGTVIMHSHPFSKTQGTIPHKHANMEEIVFFHTLSSLHAGDGAVSTLLMENHNPHSFNLITSPDSVDLLHVAYDKTSPRAPPVA